MKFEIEVVEILAIQDVLLEVMVSLSLNNTWILTQFTFNIFVNKDKNWCPNGFKSNPSLFI